MKQAKRIWRLAAILVLVGLETRAAQVDPRIEEAFRAGGEGAMVRVIVEMARQGSPREIAAATVVGRGRRERAKGMVEQLQRLAAEQQGPVREQLRRLEAEGRARSVRPFWVFNGLAATVTESALAELAGRPDVREIRLDFVIPQPRLTPAGVVPGAAGGEWNIELVRAPEVWALAPGYDGTGTVVGSFDTGVDDSHPDMGPRYRGNHRTSWYDPYDEHRTPFDSNGHGTHTTGTAVGGDAGGTQIGVAPGARWIAAKGWSDEGMAYASTFHQIFEWFLAPGGDPDAAPDVVNNSWAFSEVGCPAEFVPDIEAWRAAGIFPAFASGNEGPDLGSVRSPGAYPGSFTVGATDPFDGIAFFSGQGPSGCDGGLKPDVTAPGDGILSAVPGGYSVLSGTSMATPHVAGAVAVLRSVKPELTVEQLEEALVLGARDLGEAGPDYAFGNGRLDLYVSAQIALRGAEVPVVRVLATGEMAMEAGGTNGVFTFSRTASTAEDLTVRIRIGGDAVPGEDYEAIPTEVVIPAGSATATLVVTAVDDPLAELDERVEVTVEEDPAYIVSGTSRAEVTVVSDELLSDLVVASLGAPTTAAAGQELAVSDSVRNQGAGSSEPCELRLFLSADLAWDSGDLQLGTRAVPALGPGAMNGGTTTGTLPADLPTGSYYLLAVVDAAGVVVESGEENNLYPRAVLVGPDLVVSVLSIPAVAGAGGTLAISETTRNQGGGIAPASVTRYYLSTNTVVDGADVVLGERSVSALGAGAAESGTVSVTLPGGLTTGTWYVIARSDAADAFQETSEGNNTQQRSTQVGPDLTVTSLACPAVAAPGQSVMLDETTKNQGGGLAAATVTRYYLSRDTVVDATDAVLGSRAIPVLAGGASSAGSVSVTLPTGLESGTWFVLARCDADGAVGETAEQNNLYARSLSIGADLVLTAFTAPAIGGPGVSLAVSDTTKNQGGAAAGASATEYYLSQDGTVGAGDVLLGSRAVPALAAGASQAGSLTVTLPGDVATGSWYLIARCDGPGTVVETTELNNTSVRSIQVGPDLAIASMTVPSTAAAGESISITEATRNQGGGGAGATTTGYYLSVDGVWDGADVALGVRAVGALAAGESSSGVTVVSLPPGLAPGSYSILARCDVTGAVGETAENNNVYGRILTIGPDLVMASLTAPASAGAGQSISLSETTRNQGGGAAGASDTRYYLSADGAWDGSDVLLGSRAVPALAGGASSSGSVTVILPAELAAGTYYMFAVCDAASAVAETAENNNTSGRSMVVGADLIVAALTGPGVVAAGQTISLTDTTRNQGGGAAGSSQTEFYLSRDTLVDGGDIWLGSRMVGVLAAGASSSGSVTVTIPASVSTGTWFFVARCDGAGGVSETAEGNNLYGRSVMVGGDLVVTALTVPATAAAGQSLSVSDTTSNQGGGAVGASVTAFYLSANTALDGDDILLGTRAVGALAAGTGSSGTTTLTLPAGIVTGGWNVLAVCDAEGAVVETAENNNVTARSVAIGPDLLVSSLSAPATAGAGQSISLSDTTRNGGGAAAGGSTTRFHLSVDGILDAGDVLLGGRVVTALAAGASSAASTSVTLPAGLAAGTYTLIARADAEGAVAETSEANNLASRTIVIGSDLVVSALTAPGTAAAGQVIALGDTTKNNGGSAAGASVTRFYLSANSTWEATDLLLGGRSVPALASGASSVGSTGVTLPGDAATGTWFLIARCDDGGVVPETAENNNLYALSIRVGPDLTVTSITAPSTGGAGASLSVSDTTRNQGGAAAGSSVTEYYLSLNGTWEATDIWLGSRSVGMLAAGASSSGSATVVLPADTATGTWYLLARCDGSNTVLETTENNNVTSRSIQVGPDLVISAMTVPTKGTAGSPITVSETTRNQGGGGAAATVTRLYLSADAAWDAGDVLLGERSVGALGAGASSSVSTSVTLPATTVAGTWYVLARADTGGSVVETAEQNNTYARSLTVSAP